MMRLRCALLAVAVFAAPAAVRAQDPLEEFDAYVAEAVREFGVPGVGVAVVKDGRTVFARGYGTTEIGGGHPVDPLTLFSIGSTTKAMTAAALGMMVDEGRLDWDDAVIEHLPWFRVKDPVLTAEITVRDLLTHRAGMPNADYLWYEQDATRRDIVERMRHVEAAYSLRSGFIYQNIMYAAAGLVLESVSGMTWDEFVRSRIFNPIGMSGAVATLSEADLRDNVAAPHAVVDGAMRVIENASVDNVAPAGSVWAGVGDMARWAAFLLRDCTTESGEALLAEATCDELFRPQAIIRNGFYPTTALTKPAWTTYGLGWFQHDYLGRQLDFHTGSIDGMTAIIGLVRDADLGVYVLGNGTGAEIRHALMYRVIDLYLADRPRDWAVEIKQLYDGLAEQGRANREAQLAQRVEGTRPSRPPVRYLGTYRSPLYGTVEVTAGDGGLHVRYGRRAGVAEHFNFDSFMVEWETRWRGSAIVSFHLDALGNVESLEMSGMTFRPVD